MRTIHLNFKRIAHYIMPPTLRRKYSTGELSLRLWWWYYLAKALDVLFYTFRLERDENRVRANVTSQIILLEWYLQRQLHPDIYIDMPSDGGVFISNSYDLMLLPAVAGLSTVPELGFYLAMFGIENADFIVFTPAQINHEEIHKIVNNYKFLSITHKIETI